MLIVVSGLPGAGKSTVADAIGTSLRIPVFSVDPIEAAMWRSGVPASFETGVAAYEVAAVLAEHQLRLGVDAIIDAVSAIEVARRMWRDVAQRTRSKLQIIEVVCSDESLHRLRLESRQRGIDGFPEPTWGQVLTRRAEYVPWRDERLVLDTVEDLSETLPKALAFLRPDDRQ